MTKLAPNPIAPIHPEVDMQEVAEQIDRLDAPAFAAELATGSTVELIQEDQAEGQKAYQEALLELDLDTEPKIYLYASEGLAHSVNVYETRYARNRPNEEAETIAQNEADKTNAFMEIIYAYSQIDEVAKAQELCDEIFPIDEASTPEEKHTRALAIEIIAKGSDYEKLKQIAPRELDALGIRDVDFELFEQWITHRSEDIKHANPQDSLNGQTDGRYKPSVTIDKFIENGADAVKEVIDGARADKRARTALNVVRAICEFSVARHQYLLSQE